MKILSKKVSILNNKAIQILVVVMLIGVVVFKITIEKFKEINRNLAENTPIAPQTELPKINLETTSWKTYQDPIYKYSFKYPQEIDIRLEQKNDLYLHFPSIPESGYRSTFVRVLVLENDENLKNPRDWYKKVMNSDSSVCCMDESIIAGNQVISYGYVNSNEDWYVFVRGRFIYIFHFFDKIPNENEDKYWRLREEFWKTLKFN